jgi:pyruvate dehydrogenase E2 component (dihydrolipoamide acetyltransferase)
VKEAALDNRAKKNTGFSESNKDRQGHFMPLTRIQRLIGERMLESKRSKPCFYIELSADVTELMGLRSKLSKSLGVKITSNAFFIRALAMAAGKYPLMTGTLGAGSAGDNIKMADYINVGFAVNAPQGLVVPVIKDADKKTLAEIAELEKLLTDKARSNKLTLEEMDGETIALSNLGAYGIDSFVGIVPPPTSVILAVGSVTRTVVPEQGKATVRKMTSLTLAVDHRIINGTYAAAFLNFVKEQLERPRLLT